MLFTVKKEDPAFAESSYTLWRGLLGGTKKKTILPNGLPIPPVCGLKKQPNFR